MGLDLSRYLAEPSGSRQGRVSAPRSARRGAGFLSRLGKSSAGRRFLTPPYVGWRRPAVSSVLGPAARTARSEDGPSTRLALEALARTHARVQTECIPAARRPRSA